MWPFNKKDPKVDVKFSASGEILTAETYIDDKLVAKNRVDISDMTAYKTIYNECIRLKVRLSMLENNVGGRSNETSSIWHVLGCMPTTDRIVIEKAYRRMAMVYHPDSGGSSGAFQTLTKAKEKALNQCK